MQTIFLSDLKVALLEHPQAWIAQMEQQTHGDARDVGMDAPLRSQSAFFQECA